MEKIFMCLIFVIAMRAYTKLIKFDDFFAQKIFLNISFIVLNISAICYIKELNTISFGLNSVAVLLVLLSRIESQYFNIWLEWVQVTNESLLEKILVFLGVKINNDFLNFMDNKIKKTHQKKGVKK